MRSPTLMAKEIAEIPDVTARQMSEAFELYRGEGARLRELAPRSIVTCARGTSDQAAIYFKYLIELMIGVPVASIGPSVGSVYGANLLLDGGAVLSISQSGGSPDLSALQSAAKQGGARAIAILNVPDSPVGRAAERVLPLLAGPELAVAATKSFIASLIAVATIVAEYAQDAELLDCIRQMPETLSQALAMDWSALSVPLANASSAFVVSRGPGLAVAGEAALKLKETCRVHAEAYSAAEVLHGPIALARDRFVTLVFVPDDASRGSVLLAAKQIERAGATVFVVGGDGKTGTELPSPQSPHPLLTPICQAVAFYAFVESLSLRLGQNPDAPHHLKKVTETV